jgi:hypothetical protein
MVVAIDVEKDDLETLQVKLHLTGLTVSTRYDLFRLQVRYLGKDDADARRYEHELPDRRALWSTVAHRVGWEAPATSADFRDYECPRRPTKYFICESDVGGPQEWDFSDGPYPYATRGILDSEVVHFNQDLADAMGEEPDEGTVLVRSTDELALYAIACVVEIDGPVYTARGTEHAVMGSQYPVYISDSREARRGTLSLMTRNLGQYNDLRRIVFPASGRIRPVLFQSGGDSTLLLDDMRVIPLDVEVEQATQHNADLRYVHIDYVEVDPSTPLVARSGDNDDLVSAPEADFSISDATPAVDQWVTLTDTSTGAGDSWEWTVDNSQDNQVGKFYTEGPHVTRFSNRGTKTVKLRFGGSGAGFHTRTKTIEVG